MLLYLTVYNCDTGAVLYESARQMPAFSVSGDRLEDCRQELAKLTHLRLVTVRLISMHQPTWFADGNVQLSQYEVDDCSLAIVCRRTTHGRFRELASDASAH